MDPLLVYGLLFISQILGKLKPVMKFSEAQSIVTQLSYEQVPIPGAGNANFPLNMLYEKLTDKESVDMLTSYLTLFRLELSARLLALIYSTASSGSGSPSSTASGSPLPDALPSKWWLSFQKRRFMNKTL